MSAPDPLTFAPKDAQDFLQGIAATAAVQAGKDWETIKDTLSANLSTIAALAWKTQTDLSQNKISQAEADFALQTQETLLSATMNQIDFLVYVTAQNIRDAVFKLVAGGIKNLTGIALVF